ncbi:MAG: NADH dehydrogenase (quinone) subunit G [Caldilineae bacterium]|nr:MAG: NADH dehydrogenase (quinone) subunit G [Caldilineae bacterium]
MSDMVTLTIDGVEVSVPKGTLIVEAARQIGNEIPVFCYHAKLEPVGMCRMCLVTVGTPAINRATGEPELDEDGKPVIRFFPKPLTACTTPVSPGMVVITQSEESLADRRAVLEFLLTSHPLDCPVCDKGGECPLQDLTFAHGPGKSRFPYEAKHHGPKKYPLGDLIVLDTERCILCARCVRFQDEIAGDPVLAIENRGRDARIVSYSNPPFDSHYAGNTADICPVGALTTRDFRFGARAWELTNVPSLCNHCGVGCNTVLGTRRGEIKRIMPRQNEAVNEIWICDKGRFGHHFNGSPRRLTTPLLRKNGELVEASWEEALTRVAHSLGAAGPQAGGIAGARLSNEDLYLFQKLFREVLESRHVDHRTGLSAALSDEIGHEVGAGVGTDIGRLGADSAVLVIGADVDEEAPVLYLRLRGAARRGAHLINAGGRPTKLDRAAQTTLRYRYGAEAHMVWGMVAVVLEEGLTKGDFVAGRLNGLDALQSALRDFPPAKAAAVAGLPEADLRAAARTFAAAENGLILFGLESGGDPSLQAAIRALALLTGHAGRANNGVIAVLPHANSRGAADLGVLPHRLPGYVPLEGEAGLSAREMLQTGSGLTALYIVAADPAAESDAAAEAIRSIGFVVVQDLFLTETAKLADVVLPARGIAERDGTFTSIERRVQAFDIGVPAPGQAWADWLIFTALAGRLGADWPYASADGVMADITQTVPLYAEMSFENLLAPITLQRKMSHYIYSGMSFTANVREGLPWRTRAEVDGTTFEVAFVPPADPPQADWLLVAPRLLYDGGVLIGQAEVLAAHLPAAHARFPAKDAARLGLQEGMEVTLAANGVSVRLPARLDRRLPSGVVLVPRNLPGSPAEKLLAGRGAFVPLKVQILLPETA